MDVEEFRKFAKVAVDYIANYMITIPERNVLPNVEPGYLAKLLPSEAPENGEPWEHLLKDFNNLIVPGLTHWQSPNFYAHYPATCSYPSAVADFLSTGLGVVAFNWITGPAITELEVVMMDWLGKLLDLPKDFLNCSEGPGGGIIKGTASEATLVCLLAAKNKKVNQVLKLDPTFTDAEIKGKLVAYTSIESNSSVEKSGLLGSMPIRLVPVDEHGAMNPKYLKALIEKDIEDGLIPCYVVATLGTTGTCAFDNLEDLGPICKDYDVWMHVDAAYAGAAFACPEFRYLKNGLEYSESFNFNPHKLLLVHFDCSVLWIKNSNNLTDAFNVERSYLQHEHVDSAPEYLHWQIPLGRRFRSLKIWFVLRSYGVEGVREHIRRHVFLAKYYASLVEKDDNFEVYHLKMGLVSFRMKGSDAINQTLLDTITNERHLFLSSYTFNGNFLLRFIVNHNTSESDIDVAWNYIRAKAKALNMEWIELSKSI